MHCVFLKALPIVIILVAAVQAPITTAQTFTEAMSSGDTAVVFRLRYESVEQDNVLKDANALTLRSLLQYDTGRVNGFSASLQFEDVRIIAGLGDYSVPPTGYQTGRYSVIADPESTELNQAFVKYINNDLTIKAGRQVINYDNQRFVGAVGWRQDWQVHDALSVEYNVSDKLSFNYNYIDQRNRIFANATDIDSSDHLFHASYTSPIGSIAGYAYLLELDNTATNKHDTYGLRLSGIKELGEFDVSYLAEFATQDVQSNGASFNANYSVLEGSVTIAGVSAKLTYEVLGSDGGLYGFSTPLATAHAFNGWSDMFLGTPSQGLQDFYLSLSSKVFGGAVTAVLHDYNAENSTLAIDNLGQEINLQYIRPINDNYTLGLKYSKYSGGDITAKPDTKKLWLWFQLSF